MFLDDLLLVIETKKGSFSLSLSLSLCKIVSYGSSYIVIRRIDLALAVPTQRIPTLEFRIL